MKKSLIVVVAAAASAFAAGTLVASLGFAQTPSSPSFGQNNTDCRGVNSCKGQNACKGQGWVQGLSSLECAARGGSTGFAGGA